MYSRNVIKNDCLFADLFALAIKRVLLVLISENSWIAREETVLGTRVTSF